MDILYSEHFKKSAKRLSKRYLSLKKDLQTFVESLVSHPEQGTQLSKNIYKIRLKNSDNNKGKSAGYRVITYLIADNEILLVDIYSKNELATLSEDEINITIQQYKKEK